MTTHLSKNIWNVLADALNLNYGHKKFALLLYKSNTKNSVIFHIINKSDWIDEVYRFFALPFLSRIRKRLKPNYPLHKALLSVLKFSNPPVQFIN